MTSPDDYGCLRPEGASENSPGRKPWVQRPTPEATIPPRRGGARNPRPFGAGVIVIGAGWSPWTQGFRPGLFADAPSGRRQGGPAYNVPIPPPPESLMSPTRRQMLTAA